MRDIFIVNSIKNILQWVLELAIRHFKNFLLINCGWLFDVFGLKCYQLETAYCACN